jgi:para-nitrobenzyl esterase
MLAQPDQGFVEVAASDATYRGNAGGSGLAFLGVPYASNPARARRFLAPLPLEARPGAIVEVTAPGLSPPQIRRDPPEWAPRQEPFATGEDCLNLSLWTPAADGRKRPVLVHVFGGGFQTGSANGGYHDGAALAAAGDVVVVRLNFRIGALGFLFLGDAMGGDYRAGNVALLDVLAALGWVRRNISAFGGDPDNVTLFGLSSGAFMIASLFGVDGARGLFRRVWLMSGSASRIIARETANAMTRAFLVHVGVREGDAAALAGVPLDRILAAQEAICATDLGERNAPGGRTLGVVLDGETLKHHPLDALKSGDWKDVDIVAGWTRNEARLWYATGIMTPPRSRDELLGIVARFAGCDAAATLARLEHANPGATPTELAERFLGDTIYRKPAIATAMAHTQAGGHAWTYEFAYVAPFENGRLGASHGFDEPFFWGAIDPDRIPFLKHASRAAALSARMRQALLDFARSGSPGWSASIDGTPRTYAFS